MYAAVDSREVRGQTGMSHNQHQASLVPLGWFSLADREQSPGAEEELCMGWRWTPRPQHLLWLCPSVPGGRLHPMALARTWAKGWRNSQNTPPAEVHGLGCVPSGAFCHPCHCHLHPRCSLAPHQGPNPPMPQLEPSPLLSASASWSKNPTLSPQLQPGGLILHPAVT